MTTNSRNVLRIARYFRHETHDDIVNFNKGRPVGLVLIELDRKTGECAWGYSLCHKDDRFSKETAWFMAEDSIGGIVKNPGDKPIVYRSNITDPDSMSNVVNSLPQSLRRTAVQVATTALRRYYLKGIHYNWSR